MKIKRILSYLLILVLVLNLLPVASYADGPGYYTTLIDGESFESGMFPADWTTSQQSNSYFWSVNKGLYENGYGHTSDGLNAYVAHNQYSEYERAYLILPNMDLSGYYGAQIHCSFINPTWGSSYDVFGVCYRINGGEWVELYHTVRSYATWTNWSGSLPKAAMTYDVDIAFYAKCVPGKYGHGIGLDDVTLEATTVPRIVTYKGNGGTGTTTDPNNPYGYGCKVPTLANAFTPPSGMAFAGWNTRADGSGRYYAAGSSINLFANTTLYAQWGQPVIYKIPTVNGNRVTGSTTETLTDYAVVTDQDIWSETVSGGWYVVDHDTAILNSVRIEGDVKLVLCDSNLLKLPGGIELQGDANSLTIYAGSTGSTIVGSGRLYAGTSDAMNASTTTTGIGSTGISDDAEIGYDRVHLTINGGRITAIGGSWSAAIGGAGNSAAGIITINGGEIYAFATHNGAGIGGGSSGGSGGAKDMKIYINGGTVCALGNNNGYAIGAGTSGINVPVKLCPFAKVSVGAYVYKSYDRQTALGNSNEVVIVEPCLPHSMTDGHCEFCEYIEATVTYDGNGATGGSAPTATSFTGACNDTIILPEAGTLVKEGGYSFVGWNTQADGDGKTYKAGDKFMVSQSVKLYAKWQRNHTHSFTYTASGNTITASCTDGCDITQGLTLTVSAPDGTPVYDGTTTYRATLNTDYNATAFPGTYEIAYTKDGRAFDGVPTEAGTYDASVTVGEGDAAVTASVTYTIAQIDGLVVSLDGSSYTYDGNPHAITNAPTSNAISGTTQYMYSFEQSGTYVSDLTTRTKTAAGVYTVYVKAVNPNYNNIATTTATLSITPKAATITADAKSKVYDNDPTTDPELTAQVTGVVEGETLNYTLSRAEGQNADEYDITVTLGSNPNYTVSTTGAKFTITPKAATITADAKSKVYDNDPTTDPELTAQVTGVVEGETLNYSLSRAEGQDVGKYDITVTLGSNPNYTVSTTGAQFEITQAQLELTFVSATAITYGQTLQDSTVSGIATNRKNGAVVAGTFAFTDGTIAPTVADSDTTEYEVTFTPTNTKGYYLATTMITLTVNKAEPAFTAPTAKELVYTGEAQALVNAGATADGTLLYSLDGETYAEAIPTATDLGTYTVWYKVQGDANHLDSEPATLTVEIALTIAGADTETALITFIENGERLYRYDVSIRNIPAGFKAVGLEVYLTFDTNVLTLKRIKTDEIDWMFTEAGDKLLFAWASDTELALENGQVLFSVIFSAPNYTAGAETLLPFVENAMNLNSSVAVLKDGRAEHLPTATADGRILFTVPLWGDANADGKVTSADAALVLRAVVGLSELSAYGAFNADVDGDLAITAEDAALILQFVVGRIEHFPVE